MNVSFVVESNPEHGRGHLSRMLVLRDAVAALGVSCRLYLTHSVDGVAAAMLTDALPPEGDIVVVDGYWFDDALLARLRARAQRLVLIDDLAEQPHPADIVLNHNLYAETLDYSAWPIARLLLGPRYALIRPDFFHLSHRPLADPPRILVTLGGGTTAALGRELAEALKRRLNIGVDVALGGSDLVALMGAASLVICGLGVTFLEAIAAGMPTIGVVLADNQRLAFEAARRDGYCVFGSLDIQGIVAAAERSLADPDRGGTRFEEGGADLAARMILGEA